MPFGGSENKITTTTATTLQTKKLQCLSNAFLVCFSVFFSPLTERYQMRYGICHSRTFTFSRFFSSYFCHFVQQKRKVYSFFSSIPRFKSFKPTAWRNSIHLSCLTGRAEDSDRECVQCNEMCGRICAHTTTSQNSITTVLAGAFFCFAFLFYSVQFFYAW